MNCTPLLDDTCTATPFESHIELTFELSLTDYYTDRVYNGKRNVCRRSGRPSVCLSHLFSSVNKTLAAHTKCDSSGAARDAASVHFCPSIRTDILVVAAS